MELESLCRNDARLALEKSAEIEKTLHYRDVDVREETLTQLVDVVWKAD